MFLIGRGQGESSEVGVKGQNASKGIENRGTLSFTIHIWRLSEANGMLLFTACS